MEIKKKLKHDVISLYDSELFASQGDEVTIISDHGNVMIVEDKNGKRFSCMTKDLTDEEVIINTDQSTELENINKPVQRKVKGKIAAPLNNQQQLF